MRLKISAMPRLKQAVLELRECISDEIYFPLPCTTIKTV